MNDERPNISTDLLERLLEAFSASPVRSRDDERVRAFMSSLPPDDRTRRLWHAVLDVLETLDHDDTVLPASEVVARAVTLLDAASDRVPVATTIAAKASDASTWAERTRLVLARLVFDSAAQPALAGFRGRVERRQLVFEWAAERAFPGVDAVRGSEGGGGGRGVADAGAGGSGRLEMQLTPITHSPSARLRAAVSAAPDSICDVLFLTPANDAPVARCATDARGHFRIDLMPGRYEIQLNLGNQTVRTPPFDVT